MSRAIHRGTISQLRNVVQVMQTEQLIRKLKASNLYAQCSCEEEFKLSNSLLFDGTKPLAEEVLEIQSQLKGELDKA